MTAPTLGAYVAAQKTTNSLTLGFTVPSYSAGDTLYVAYVDDADAGTPSIDGTGWTAVVNNATIAASGVPDSGSFSLWKRPATGSNTSYTVTSDVSERGLIVAWIGQNDGGFNVAVVTTNGTNSSPSVAALTTTVADCLRISIIAASADRTPVGTLPGHTLLVTNAFSSAGMISVQYEAIPTAGTDASVSTTLASSYWSTFTFAIAPVASGISGSASLTQADNTVAATGTVAVAGSASPSQAGNTLSAAGED